MLRYLNYELHPRDVPAAQRIRAEGTAHVAARLLELPSPVVRYFATIPSLDACKHGDALLAMLGKQVGVIGESDYGHEPECWLEGEALAGLARRDEPLVIWVNPLLDEWQTVNTTLHEMRHRWQFAHLDDWRERSRDEWEADARAYATAHEFPVAATLEAAYQAAQAALASRR